nr:MAG: RNA-dependent RNA polymerase [Chemarfal virus 173]
MRYCYTLLNPDNNCQGFKENVSLMTYGDDNVMGVRESIPWFNHTAIQTELAKIGVEYTMADKESESVPYINISDVTFLKRAWRWDEDVKAWLAPLEEASIQKSLTVWVPSGTINKWEQMIQVMNSASNEYFFYGRKKHNEMRSIFLKMASQPPFAYYMQESHFPDFDQLVERFRRASEQLVTERS